MQEKKLLDTVMLAGELMLSGGAEVYRVEDTMNHMLKRSGYQDAEVIAFVTGIFVTLSDPQKETLTLTRRIRQRGTNINRIYRVNDISRRFCCDSMSVDDAYAELKEIQAEVLYSPLMKAIGTLSVPPCFSPMFGGNALDFFACALVGACLAIADRLCRRIRLNDFCSSACGSFVVAFSALLINRYLLKAANSDVMIISSIMPLVPGVTFTTAIRDVLNGDYSAGTARILEASVIALAVAAGVGVGMMLFRTL